jgi:hypothetical protein
MVNSILESNAGPYGVLAEARGFTSTEPEAQGQIHALPQAPQRSSKCCCVRLRQRFSDSALLPG